MILDDDLADTYLFDEMVCYRVNWNAPLEMMSTGCIRARECSWTNGRACLVALAT